MTGVLLVITHDVRVTSEKLTSSEIQAPALTPAVARCSWVWNGAARVEAGLSLPEVTPASPYTSLGEMPLLGPPPGSAGRAASEDTQGHHQKPPRCCGTRGMGFPIATHVL